MAIEYSDPETRNLSIISMAFIVYYLGGGSFPKDQLSLQVISIEFEKPLILAIIAWIMLFWFLYRYWVTHKGIFSKQYWSEVTDYKNHPHLRRYVEKKLENESLLPIQKIPPHEKEAIEEGWVINEIAQIDGKTSAVAEYATDVTRDKYGNIKQLHDSNKLNRIKRESRGDQLNKVIYLKGWQGKLTLSRINIKYFIENRIFSDYIVPYLLFCFAIISWLYSCISKWTACT